ncbi:MAG TPA: hypothetical protein VG432_01235 [Gemmatimonadaceae bacterium]|nr:hypothetical protein [Gemmatimonadaceae bacterium]
MVSFAVAVFAAASLHAASLDTARVADDTVPVAPETLHEVDTLPPADTVPAATVAFDFGAGAAPGMRARSLELGVSTAPNPYLRNQLVATTRLRFLRRPDSLSAEFARRVSTSERIPVVEVEIRPGPGGTPMVVRMHDVQVVSTKVTAHGDDSALRHQRLALTESVAQVRADLEEAQRQLTVTASLEKRHLASAVELARARGARSLLEARLAVQEQRLALVEHELDDWMPFEEEVVLVAARAEAATRPGAR